MRAETPNMFGVAEVYASEPPESVGKFESRITSLVENVFVKVKEFVPAAIVEL